jgi:hypothetical protein
MLGDAEVSNMLILGPAGLESMALKYLQIQATLVE